MTFREYFFLFLAVVFFIGFWIGEVQNKKSSEENHRLREALKIEHNRAEYFRRKSEHNSVFDFEKVNDKGEK